MSLPRVSIQNIGRQMKNRKKEGEVKEEDISREYIQ